MKSKFKWRGISYLALAAILFTFAACNQAKTNNDNAVPSAQTASAEDQRIEKAVKEKLAQDPSLKNSDITVESKDAIVDLRGTAPTLELAQHASQVAQSVEGVRTVNSYVTAESAELNDQTDTGSTIKEDAEKAADKVENGIKEIGSDTRDAAITAEVKMKLASDKAVEATKIEVETENRHVVLKGTVATKREATRAIQLARSIKDVASVSSQLTVSPESGT